MNPPPIAGYNNIDAAVICGLYRKPDKLHRIVDNGSSTTGPAVCVMFSFVCMSTLALLSLGFALLSMPSSSSATMHLQNITITVPIGTTNHSDPRLLCTPTKWTDIVVFFLGNYVAHAATVKSLPGEPMLSVLFAGSAALLFPTSE